MARVVGNTIDTAVLGVPRDETFSGRGEIRDFSRRVGKVGKT